ncbi:MAG TPA: PAS domain-containing sensor histidine kinase [Microbacteriaceae bacterium]|jgi:signal transduction histidine kinase|nr:PAS domain-containing sensor histidine kinase [Microbacteriaceae bacterium]
MRRLSVDTPSPALKQLPTAVVFSVAVLLAVFAPAIVVIDYVAIFSACVVMAGATLLSLYFSRLGRITRWALIVPGFSLLGIALLRAGTGGVLSLFSALLILPVLWIAAEKGRRWVIVAMVGTFVSLMLPYALYWHAPETQSEWLRGIFGPLVFGVVAAIVNELSRQGRQQMWSIQRLAQEREGMLRDTLSFAGKFQENELSLHAANRLTRSVLDAVTEQSVIGTDLTGFIDVWNPGAAAMLGLTAHETQGKRYIFEFHVADELETRSRELNYPPGATVLNPGFSALVESARLGRAEVRDWTYVRHDGSQLSVSVAVTPRADEEGATIGYIFVATDVTQALEVARLKDEFVGLISHELRTPLSSILGYLELMRDDDESPLSDEQLQYLGVAERNAHRLLRLVGDLLFTAQVASGKFPLDVGKVTLSDVVTAAVQSAGPVAAAAGVELLIELPGKPVVVRGDAVRLGQACDNLISNAVKFTPRGGTVTVALGSTAEDAIVSVRDTGMGIPESELDQLYARFFRASTATRNAVPGVGLGLTITKAIVTAHEGALDVESEEGVGTLFSMSLPLPREPLLDAA